MAVHSAFTDESTTISEQEYEHEFNGLTSTADEDGLFEHILVAVDDKTNETVSGVALSLAAAYDAQVDALSVVRMNASVDHWDMVVERREDGAEAALDAVGDVAAERDVSVTKRLRYGTPAEEIEQYAEHNDVDLIVVGEPNRTGLRRFLSPKSVADRVRKSTSIPVLTV
ncbi:universal stress protein [Haloprofundus salilacus]|uniref:universal stress protein n=1 Tax=Haloprofundus salilacus TaxID=2876190 RepID=UPI001CCEB5C8|nr:universal stress protein [Haloprofundus salilacus]